MTLVLALSAALLASEAVPEAVVQAVEQVESSGRGAKTPKGDNGKAIGCLQWHSSAWADCSAMRSRRSSHPCSPATALGLAGAARYRPAKYFDRLPAGAK